MESINIPEGIICKFENNILTCAKENISLTRNIAEPSLNIKVEGKVINLSIAKGNKKDRKVMKSLVQHIGNIFIGLDKKYIYNLEACNVHFPMTLKIEGQKLIINNFLGEKTPRKAVILPNVDVQIKGKMIVIESHDKESAGQTAANFEKATKVRNRDRRVFQDGIFIVDKPGRKI